MKRGSYLAVSLWENNKGKLWTVHKLVALAFLGPPPTPKHAVAHYDGDKTNNHFTNLRWATKAENEADKIRHGRTNRGERNGQAKITDAQAEQIKQRCGNGEKASALAAEYGISSSAISNIYRGIRRATKKV